MKLSKQGKSQTYGWCTILKLRIIIFLLVCCSNKNNFLLYCQVPQFCLKRDFIKRELEREEEGEFIMFSLSFFIDPGKERAALRRKL